MEKWGCTPLLTNTLIVPSDPISMSSFLSTYLPNEAQKMPQQPVPKRTQFSSCDACRLSRVACDASKGGSRPDGLGSHDSCSRCRRRKESCTFEVSLSHVLRNNIIVLLLDST